MGVIDRLFFWRKHLDADASEFDIDINGCFTLPGAEIGQEPGPVDEPFEHLSYDEPLEEIDAGLK